MMTLKASGAFLPGVTLLSDMVFLVNVWKKVEIVKTQTGIYPHFTDSDLTDRQIIEHRR
jgi:hypothetical protein